MKKLVVTLSVIVLLCLSGFAFAASAEGGYEFYFQQLDANQQALYRVILEAPAETASYTVVLPEDGVNYENISAKLHTVMETVKMDHPESMAWLDWYQDGSYDETANTITFKLVCSDYYDPDDQAKSEKLIDTIVAAADPSWDLYTKAMFVSNVVVDAMDYDLNVTWDLYGGNGKADYYNSNIYCVNNGYGICGGFSKLYKAIADRIGLPCVEVASVGHAWVHVQMEDGNWYGVEPQDPLALQGTSTMLGSYYVGGNDMYELYNGFFGEENAIRQPERTTDDYVYMGEEQDPGSVDLTQVRLENAATETSFTYTVNEDGKTCTITGFEGKESGDLFIPSVLDGYTVTVIGNSAFTYSDFDGSLSLPDTLEVIDLQAFAGCQKLTGQLVLPGNLKTIRAGAFIGCSGFTGEIIFNDKLESIGYGAFSRCEGLSGSLFFPDSIVELGDNAVSYCSGLDGVIHIPTGITNWSASYVSMCDNLTGYDVSADHPNYRVVDGILYSRDMTKLLSCSINRTGALVIPEGVTTIGEQALYRCEKLTSISFPSTLKRIEALGCAVTTGITEKIILPDTLEYLGEQAFLASNGLEGTLVIPAGLQLAEGVFRQCQRITTVIVEEGVNELPFSTFNFATGIKTIYLPSTLQNIGNACFSFVTELQVYGYSGTAAEAYVNSAEGQEICAVFHPMTDGYALEENEINLFLNAADNSQTCQLSIVPQPPTTTVIWASADESVATVEAGLVTGVAAGQTVITATFGQTTLQCKVEVSDGVQISSDGKTLIKVSEGFSGKLTIPEGVESIGEQAIVSVGALTGISFPSTLKSLGVWSLYGAGSLHDISIILPESVTHVSNNAFVNNRLAYLRYPVGAEVGSDAFMMNTIGVLDIPEGVTALPEYAFSSSFIGSCYLPVSLNSAPLSAFEGATVETFYGYSGTYAESYVKELQAKYPDMMFTFVYLGESINLNACTLVVDEIVKLTWKAGVTWTSDNEAVAAVDKNGLVTALQEGVANITATAGDGTFVSCQVTVLPLCYAGHIEAVDEAVAATCTATGLTEGKHCSVCGEILTPQELVPMEEHQAVRPSDSMPAVPGVNGIKAKQVCLTCETTLEDEHCIQYEKTLFLPDSVEVIESEAFFGCAAQQITIPSGVQTIESKAFANCRDLLMVVITGNVQSIADDAFVDCEQLMLVCTSNDAYVIEWAEANGVEYILMGS